MAARDSRKTVLPDFAIEQGHLSGGMTPVAGVDEAGRGPLAGPVVAAAVILDCNAIPAGLNDSKKLTQARREELFSIITATAQTAIGIISVDIIDRDNILAATMAAMKKAVENLGVPPAIALIDGNRAPQLSCRTQTIIGGDERCLSIAAASIIAKVTRDRIMTEIDRDYPAWGFASHKGYGTKAHKQALEQYGVCPHHRRSFAPVRDLLARQ